MLFVSISNWLKSQAETSSVLSNFSIKRIYNNIDIDNFKNIPKESAMAYLKISTKKKYFCMVLKIHKIIERVGI